MAVQIRCNSWCQIVSRHGYGYWLLLMLMLMLAAWGFNLHKERGEGEELFVLGNIKYSPDVYVN